LKNATNSPEYRLFRTEKSPRLVHLESGMAREFHSEKCITKQAVLLLVLLVISTIQLAATPTGKAKRHLSRPEKIWSAFHPFKARKVLKCARRSIFVTDSLEKAGVLTDRNGGQLDAFRHAYWMALMINNGMKAEVVRKIGQRHEKGNYLDFKKGKLEDSLLADSLMSVMDLRNNDSGIKIGEEFRSGDKKLSLIETVIKEIWNGKLAIMSKNADGDYLDCNGTVITPERNRVKWYIPKCIVSSDRIVVPH
jgi:hypothetical protein